MQDEALRCQRINGKNPWYIDRERAIEVIPEEQIRNAAVEADAAVITIGRVFGEGKDRDYYHSYLLSDREQKLIDEVAEALRSATGTELTAIGRIVEGGELRWFENGAPAEIELKGFTHF